MPVEDKMSEPCLANVPTRERILAAAADLFYARGLRSVSADKIIERVGITKVTFYRHFRTKDDLVVAYLERQAERERADVAVILAGPAATPTRRFASSPRTSARSAASRLPRLPVHQRGRGVRRLRPPGSPDGRRPPPLVQGRALGNDRAARPDRSGRRRRPARHAPRRGHGQRSRYLPAACTCPPRLPLESRP